MTQKFLKEWGVKPLDEATRKAFQRLLDGGCKIARSNGVIVVIGVEPFAPETTGCFAPLGTPARAVKFAAALNKLRRPLRILRKELDDVWAARVKERDAQTCVLCGIVGAKVKEAGTKDSLTAHHWLKNKARAGMARWARPCGVAVHFAEHIHLLHENPCWADLEPIYRHVAIMEGEEAIKATLALVKVPPTEERVRMLWFEMCPAKTGEVQP